MTAAVACLSTGCLSVAVLGLALAAMQAWVFRRHLKEAVTPPSKPWPRVSILKPLCGIDDGLEENLESFRALDYPEYEVLLGVRDMADPAYRVARRLEASSPGRFRVVLQRGEPGLNPKVNQLLTLSRSARSDVLVISDSNVRVRPDYLKETVALLAQPGVGLVTHAVAGVGDLSMGAAMDNAYLATTVSPGVVSTWKLLRRPVVVGKSMALTRDTLVRIGGFAAYADVLAEDYLMGEATARAGLRVEIAPTPIFNVSVKKTVEAFHARFIRWSTMQRKVVGLAEYTFIAVQNPLPWAFAAFVLTPDMEQLRAFLACGVVKTLVDASVLRWMSGRSANLRQLVALPTKDFVVFSAWSIGLARNHVKWRGNRLLVEPGSRLRPVPVAARRFAFLRGA